MEYIAAAETISRSSAKHKWVSPKEWHLGWKPNLGSVVAVSVNNKENISIAITKR